VVDVEFSLRMIVLAYVVHLLLYGAAHVACAFGNARRLAREGAIPDGMEPQFSAQGTFRLQPARSVAFVALSREEAGPLRKALLANARTDRALLMAPGDTTWRQGAVEQETESVIDAIRSVPTHY